MSALHLRRDRDDREGMGDNGEVKRGDKEGRGKGREGYGGARMGGCGGGGEGKRGARGNSPLADEREAEVGTVARGDVVIRKGGPDGVNIAQRSAGRRGRRGDGRRVW
jgi:hypothetical protein